MESPEAYANEISTETPSTSTTIKIHYECEMKNSNIDQAEDALLCKSSRDLKQNNSPIEKELPDLCSNINFSNSYHKIADNIKHAEVNENACYNNETSQTAESYNECDGYSPNITVSDNCDNSACSGNSSFNGIENKCDSNSFKNSLDEQVCPDINNSNDSRLFYSCDDESFFFDSKDESSDSKTNKCNPDLRTSSNTKLSQETQSLVESLDKCDSPFSIFKKGKKLSQSNSTKSKSELVKFTQWPHSLLSMLKCSASIPKHLVIPIALQSHGMALSYLGRSRPPVSPSTAMSSSEQSTQLSEDDQIKLAKRSSLIQHLPCKIYEGAFKRECVICMIDFDEGDKLRYLPCLHIYHNECIDDWLLRSFTCPSCLEPVDAALLNTYETA